ncbi:MAG: glycosyltransferase family 2 protein, partial [Bacteroidaceae bacterium]|nr:glycosyltransferase family 2 protein [Bacteroidaceae bacterium]
MNEVMSIVIPVYNRAVELPRTMASIVAQDYRPLRVILVDNNSTDNSLAVCHNMQQLYQEEQLRIEVVQQLQPGASAARNRGLELVDSRYMMFFDSDDEM